MIQKADPMKNKAFKIVLILALALSLLALAGCGKLAVNDLGIEHEPEFGGVYIKITIDDFNAKGFKFGDSVNVRFSNGYELKDIPYYNGYYVDAGQPLLIGYPGYDYIKAAVNYGADLWDEAELQGIQKVDLWKEAVLDAKDKATVTLNQAGKYADIQNALDISYSDDRSKFTTDEEFANFRNIKMGSIRDGILYRSASPCDNQHRRATYVNTLIEKAGVKTILDLADSEEKIKRYISDPSFSCAYFLSVYNDGGVIPLAMNMNYFSEEFRAKVANGFAAMAEKDGPYLIHCTEGKDRTGFVCMLIEALAGAKYQEIIDDYMITYDNYYKINKEKDPQRYKTIMEKNIVGMIRSIVGDDNVDITKADLSGYARNYLISGGLSGAQIDKLLKKLK